ncbi:hypothetical protein CWS96_gp10 [Saline Natrinema sp. J7-1 virus 1]|uniref:SWIM-type domain-containing protein n=1 Tax=Saline Natrinema sp. J7-1 virus 1 TaxID=2847285 RepID=A0AAE9VKT3_9VIRU|nr:hypothetical protein CWS96_gp10 [Saline Natrinema sp. J7-1 virus 1]WBE14013.1 hypothetical protein [Saline Natrinema sp. J7-1 virus 1]
MSSDGHQPAPASIDEDRLDFEQAEDDMTSSWSRALEEAVEIEPMDPGEFAVSLESSESVYIVHLVGDGAAFSGRCICPGYRFHDGPCAHLCAVYQQSLEEPTLIPEVDLR